MPCMGICHRYKTKKLSISLRYAQGQRWCTNCCMYMTQMDNLCLCCHCKLRAGPRRKKNKEALRKHIECSLNLLK